MPPPPPINSQRRSLRARGACAGVEVLVAAGPPAEGLSAPDSRLWDFTLGPVVLPGLTPRQNLGEIGS